MKRLVIFAAMALVVLAAGAQGGGVRKAIELGGVKPEAAKAMQPDTVMPNGEWQRVVQSEMTAKEGFKYMRRVLAKVMPDFQQNVQLEDTTDCKLVVTAAVPLMASAKMGSYTSLLEGLYDMTLTLMMKDNRYRISCEPVKCVLVGSTPGQATMTMADVIRHTNGLLQNDLKFKAGKLIALIDAMLKKQKADEDF